ncbi:hypothetical protein [Andreprevotia lacus]|jgi:hypothetical protein|uniref:hypothetical protein n=1 Tax=Andreprevotia lacus TaxID=1121000 RepID=UPI00111C1718|nr:hypothetical protein [Andreprevotia lacus]
MRAPMFVFQAAQSQTIYESAIIFKMTKSAAGQCPCRLHRFHQSGRNRQAVVLLRQTDLSEKSRLSTNAVQQALLLVLGLQRAMPPGVPRRHRTKLMSQGC